MINHILQMTDNFSGESMVFMNNRQNEKICFDKKIKHNFNHKTDRMYIFHMIAAEPLLCTNSSTISKS